MKTAAWKSHHLLLGSGFTYSFFSTHEGLLFYKWVLSSGYTYMAVWVGGLEVWEIKVMCKIDLKNVFFFVCFVFVLFFV